MNKRISALTSAEQAERQCVIVLYSALLAHYSYSALFVFTSDEC